MALFWISAGEGRYWFHTVEERLNAYVLVG